MKSQLIAALTAIAATTALASSATAGTIKGADTEFKGLIDEGVFHPYIHTEYQGLDPEFVAAHQLDISKLDLKFDHEVKVHFLSEGAWYRNQLGVRSTGTTAMSDTILFDDIVCLTASCSTYTGYRNSGNDPTDRPLEAGDFASLGVVEAGTTLDFFLNQDGYGRSNPNRWHLDAADNSDGLQHIMAYEQSGYLVMAFEDLTNGGDKDYNDVVFAIDIGEGNMNHLKGVSVPEPTTTLGLLGIGAALTFSRRKREQQSK
ncbi:MAG: DUF4114 domain-containing protein [Limnospira sp.]